MLNYGKWGKSVMSIGADIPLRHSLRQLLKPPGNTWHCRVFKWKFCLSIYFVQNGPLYDNFLRERMQEKAEGVFGQWQFIYSLPPLYLRTPWGWIGNYSTSHFKRIAHDGWFTRYTMLAGIQYKVYLASALGGSGGGITMGCPVVANHCMQGAMLKSW